MGGESRGQCRLALLVTDHRSDIFSTGVVLAQLLLGYNIFKGSTAEQSRNRILTLPIPDFRQIDPKIDDRLNQILQRALARRLDERYPGADELLYDLEHFIYSKGYGPTNETLGKYIRELFDQKGVQDMSDIKSSTHIGARTAPLAG